MIFLCEKRILNGSHVNQYGKKINTLQKNVIRASFQDALERISKLWFD